jgi:formylglycine-generating enzyme required for sulfatase activity
MRKQMILVLAVLVLSIGLPKADATIYLDDGEIHDVNYPVNDEVWVDWDSPGMETTVNWLEGASMGLNLRHLRAYEDSRINIAGGSLDEDMYAFDRSLVTVNDGRIRGLEVYNEAQVNIVGGTMNGVIAHDNSEVIILDSDRRMGGRGNGIGRIYCYEESRATVSGGTIGPILVFDESVLTLIGSDFSINGESVGYGQYFSDPRITNIEGTLANGDSLFSRCSILDNSSIILAPVPEPATVEMVAIPGGEFEMGDHHDDDNPYELPVHAVSLDSFFMSKYEITNHQYCDYLNAAYPAQIKVVGGVVYASSDSSNSYPYCVTHSYDDDSQIDFGDPDFSVRTKGGRDMWDDPMVEVSWCGAASYCNWRSSKEGYEACYNLSTWESDFSKHGYRLPTEAEWEYAARGGQHSPYYRYPWGDSIDGSRANYSRSGDPYETGYYPWTTPVGYYDGSQIPAGSDMANGYGLYDMAGNVWEWCNDWYSGTYYSTTPYPHVNPEGPASGTYRVLRGGGWSSLAYYCRVSNRGKGTPDFRRYNFGFRIVRDYEPTNSPPVADAGDNQITYICADGAAAIELDGSSSTDADGDELEYLWTWEIEGTVFDANGVSPIIELPVGLHTVNLTVDDGMEVSEPNWCVIEVIEGIEVDLRVMPRVINRKSHMKRILAVVQLPADIDEDDIDGSFWLYPGEIEPHFSRLMTANGSQKLFMVFDKSELMAAAGANGAVVLEIEAQLISGRCLYGSDRIRIIRRGRGPKDQTGLRKGTRFRRNRVQNSR